MHNMFLDTEVHVPKRKKQCGRFKILNEDSHSVMGAISALVNKSFNNLKFQYYISSSS